MSAVLTRCSSASVKAGFGRLVRRLLCSLKRYMVSGLAAVKQWGDAEGGLLLSERCETGCDPPAKGLSASHGLREALPQVTEHLVISTFATNNCMVTQGFLITSKSVKVAH